MAGTLKKKIEILSPYRMDRGCRGKVLIFNNSKFEKLKERKLNSMDAVKLLGSLTALGYEMKQIHQHKDFTAEQMMTAMENLAAEDHKQCDSVVVVFLSYGEHNLIYTKDKQIGLQKLLQPLYGTKCESLAGKPKIIILQTCNPTEQYMDNAEVDEDEEQIRTIPEQADFVFMGSEVPGLITNREAKHGSLFIHHLCKNLKEHGSSLELRKVMTRTLRDVEDEMTKWRPDWAEKADHRMPYFISMLTRDLYLCNKRVI